MLIRRMYVDLGFSRGWRDVVTLSALGSNLEAKLVPTAQKLIKQALHGISPADIEITTRTLRIMTENLSVAPQSALKEKENGCVVYRAEWNNPSATRKALIALLAGHAVTAKPYFRPALPTTVLRTLGNAGKGSAADFFKGLPFLIWTNIIKRNLRLLFGRAKTGSGRTTC
jgi:hypothetical protein